MAAPARTRIFAVRHGETDWNVAGRLQGCEDIPLNPCGRAQAHAAGVCLAHHHAHEIHRVYSSDLSRAYETAAVIARALSAAKEVEVDVKPDPRVRETNLGVWQGHTWEQAERAFGNDSHRWKSDPDFAMPRGECLRARLHRVADFLFDVALAHAGEGVLVVAHGGILEDLGRLWNRVAFGKSTRLRKVNACICIADIELRADLLERIDAAVAGGQDAVKVRKTLISELLDPATITPEVAGAAIGSWSLVEWGITKHLHLVPATHERLEEVLKKPAELDRFFAWTRPPAAGAVPAAAVAKEVLPAEDEVVDVAATDAESEAVSGGSA